MSTDDADLKTTPLDALHRELGARMVPFAGYAMPVQYPAGIMAEHLHCRAKAALFDVSHMGQASLYGADAAAALEALVPGDMAGLKPHRQRYTILTTASGGILDDLMVANTGSDRLFLVANASRKDVDFAHIAAHLPDDVKLARHDDRALLALQGPAAVGVLARVAPEVASMPFMGVATITVDSVECFVSRSGYTGEDGFEISVPAEFADAFARMLLAQPGVMPAGLGARDSLRLEAGLCLYGNDIDETTNPVEAALTWVIGKRRRMEWNFVGAGPIRAMLENGPARLRVGIRPDGRAPARAGTEIVGADGGVVGHVTSGGFGPTLGAPIAMGYVRRDLAADGTELSLLVRGKPLPARVAPTPFVPHRYVR
ncbi:glycine cleavage system aminomethyltransferase GcvT [Limobrevibacterium gyesilva]|uniref:aminomethyltransferase n=1 Tax=Limobrevibacterium gyesilva TaxID=2991712 RepID=A0AA42CJ74_9PROT|nr:glycine cleavage system aminomethyltransferase GcvT [Limobrevibacterium gyesilva]MCW3476615.1 glycine cleavage system aminomethyltransferase GcvT [Limobrevibacterium gyesilva]